MSVNETVSSLDLLVDVVKRKVGVQMEGEEEEEEEENEKQELMGCCREVVNRIASLLGVVDGVLGDHHNRNNPKKLAQVGVAAFWLSASLPHSEDN